MCLLIRAREQVQIWQQVNLDSVNVYSCALDVNVIHRKFLNCVHSTYVTIAGITITFHWFNHIVPFITQHIQQPRMPINICSIGIFDVTNLLFFDISAAGIYGHYTDGSIRPSELQFHKFRSVMLGRNVTLLESIRLCSLSLILLLLWMNFLGKEFVTVASV